MNIHALINSTSPSIPTFSFYFPLSAFICLLLPLLLLLIGRPEGEGSVLHFHGKEIPSLLLYLHIYFCAPSPSRHPCALSVSEG